MSDVAIKTVALTKIFGKFTAVDAITFEVGKGEILASWAPMVPVKRQPLKC